MIVGIGTDLCRVSRIRQSLHRFGGVFVRKYCSDKEIEYANGQSDPAVAFAQLFAAKEAFAKAAGTGFNSDLWWDDVEIVVNDDGQLHLLISADVVSRLLVPSQGPTRIRVHVSISSQTTFCSAFVVIEQCPTEG